MIRSIDDAEIVNGFANHPDIRPDIGGVGRLDLTSAVQEPNVFLFGEHGGFCLSWSAPETYEVHTMITREGRGRWAIEAARSAIEQMIERGARQMWTRVHPEARHTAMFTRIMGFREWGTNTLDIGDGPIAWRIFNWRHECQQQ